jgi:small conductance mechanosensitive channel
MPAMPRQNLRRRAVEALAWTSIRDAVASKAYRVLLALSMGVVGYWIAVHVRKMIQAKAGTVPATTSQEKRVKTLYLLLGQIAYFVVIGVVAVVIFGIFGFETTSLAALLGACSLAIGLALQGAMSNVAAGIIITFTQPFYIGEYVEVGPITGRVIDYNLMYTDIEQLERKTLVRVPNGKFLQDTFENHSRHAVRRATVRVRLSNAQNNARDAVQETLKIMERVMLENPRVLKDNPTLKPSATVVSMEEQGTIVRANAPIHTHDFPTIMFELQTQIRVALEQGGIQLADHHYDSGPK